MISRTFQNGKFLYSDVLVAAVEAVIVVLSVLQFELSARSPHWVRFH